MLVTRNGNEEFSLDNYINNLNDDNYNNDNNR